LLCCVRVSDLLQPLPLLSFARPKQSPDSLHWWLTRARVYHGAGAHGSEVGDPPEQAAFHGSFKKRRAKQQVERYEPQKGADALASAGDPALSKGPDTPRGDHTHTRTHAHTHTHTHAHAHAHTAVLSMANAGLDSMTFIEIIKSSF
jgi:hypothetical protein